MDEEDTFYHAHHKNFYDTYKHEVPVSDLFKEKIPSLLKYITHPKGYMSYGVTQGFATRTDNQVLITSRPKKAPDMKKRYAGLLAMTIEEGGHWGAWVYTPEEGVIVWDSMSNSEYTYFFKLFIVQIFRNHKDLTIACQTCVRPRQPTGGFIPPKNGWNLNENIDRNEPIPSNMHVYAMGYNSQHQYCFAEALMFIEDHLNKNIRKCKNSRDSLEVIKKYIYNKLNRPKEYTNFLYTYNPHTRNRNKISMT